MIEYWRAELEILQDRLARIDSRAAGIVTVCVAIAGASATGLAALGKHISLPCIALLGIGGLFLIASILRAVSARDTADKPAAWWIFITVRVFRRGTRTGAILAARRKLKGQPRAFALGLDDDPEAVIVDSLRARVVAARDIEDYTDKQVRDASALLFAAVLVLTVGVVLVIAGV